jgi:hypothetical protein
MTEPLSSADHHCANVSVAGGTVLYDAALPGSSSGSSGGGVGLLDLELPPGLLRRHDLHLQLRRPCGGAAVPSFFGCHRWGADSFFGRRRPPEEDVVREPGSWMTMPLPWRDGRR